MIILPQGAILNRTNNDMGESLGLFITGIANTISEFLRDGDVQKKVTEALTDFANGFIKGFDGEDVRAALESLSDTIGGILGDTLRGIDKEGLAEDLKSVLEGLPWETVFNGLGAIVGGKLALQFFGTAFKNRASAILASLISSSETSSRRLKYLSENPSFLAAVSTSAGGTCPL